MEDKTEIARQLIVAIQNNTAAVEKNSWLLERMAKVSNNPPITPSGKCSNCGAEFTLDNPISRRHGRGTKDNTICRKCARDDRNDVLKTHFPTLREVLSASRSEWVSHEWLAGRMNMHPGYATDIAKQAEKAGIIEYFPGRKRNKLLRLKQE